MGVKDGFTLSDDPPPVTGTTGYEALLIAWQARQSMRALQKRHERELKELIDKQVKEIMRQRQSAGGKSAAETRRADVPTIHAAAERLLLTNGRHQISGILAKRFGLTRPTILKALRSHSSGQWEPKKK